MIYILNSIKLLKVLSKYLSFEKNLIFLIKIRHLLEYFELNVSIDASEE